MGRGIVKCNVDTASGLIRPLQDWVTVDGQPVGIVGCPVDSHSPCEAPDPPHCAANMTQGKSWITIDGIPVCFEGHEASCGHPATGQDWIEVEP